MPMLAIWWVGLVGLGLGCWLVWIRWGLGPVIKLQSLGGGASIGDGAAACEAGALVVGWARLGHAGRRVEAHMHFTWAELHPWHLVIDSRWRHKGESGAPGRKWQCMQLPGTSDADSMPCCAVG